MSRDLVLEVWEFLADHGPATAPEIGLAVRCRRAAVDEALAQDCFSRAPRPDGANPRSLYWQASRLVPRVESATNDGPSQCSRILAVLRDGRPHTTAEIHAAVGFCRLNSRVAELRSRGYVIECVRLPEQAGPHGQTYRLLATPESAAGEAA